MYSCGGRIVAVLQCLVGNLFLVLQVMCFRLLDDLASLAVRNRVTAPPPFEGLILQQLVRFRRLESPQVLVDWHLDNFVDLFDSDLLADDQHLCGSQCRFQHGQNQ